MTTTRQASHTSSRFENSIATLSLTGIAYYLILHYGLNGGQEIYTLNLNIALTSAVASLFQNNFNFSATEMELPLLAVAVLGGIPLVYHLII